MWINRLGGAALAAEHPGSEIVGEHENDIRPGGSGLSLRKQRGRGGE